MQELTKSILPKSFLINEKYNVLFFIKQGMNAETYRVKGIDGKLYFLKLFNFVKVHRSAFDSEGNLLEIEILKSIQHQNIASYKDSGELIYEGKKFIFLVLYFIAGETLAERISREPISTIYDIKQIAIDILSGLEYLHNLSEPIIHNEITPQNIMLDLSTDIPQAKIIDFGYARSFFQSTKSFNKEGLNLNYVASECFNNLYSPQSDLFSVAALMYHLLFGIPPWFKDVSKYQADRSKAEDIILEERNKPLAFPNIENNIIDFDESILKVITKGLQQNPENRFQSANKFMQALNGEIEEETEKETEKEASKQVEDSKKSVAKNGKGFSAIAGMKQLKDQLQHDVINLIENPEEYKKHNLGMPNGMLLYGPPGCGKTFFAERFAEEAGYNFIKIVSSDIASIYVHGSQEKIGKLFKEAREKAPTILYFDELDAMVPNRESVNNQSQSGEVNEFLSQLDNIGDSGVFVIGSTNKPDSIDKAVLRAGRLEKWFYIPPPDFEARQAMFELYLKDRPIDFGLDYSKLAMLTENYVSSDIKLLIDEASRKTIKEKEKRITMGILEFVIKHQKPTVPLSELKKYEKIKNDIEGNDHQPLSNAFPDLSTPKLKLRCLQNKDIFGFTDFFSDPETMKLFNGAVMKRDYDTFIHSVKKAEHESQTKDSIFWTITLKDQDDFIGFVRIMSYRGRHFDISYEAVGESRNSPEFLSYFDRKNGYEIDFGLLPEYRNKHLMKEALVAVIRYCKSINANPLYAKLNSVSNIASKKILEQHQFKIVFPTINPLLLNNINIDSIFENQSYGYLYKLNQA